MLRAKQTAATVMLQVVTIVDGTGAPRPRPNVKFLLNRHSQQTYEQFVRDVAYSLSRGTTTGTDAAGGAPSVRLFTVRGREVAAMSDLFRDDDVFIGVGVGRQELSVPEVRQIFQELYPRGDYAETLVRKWVRARRRQVPRRRDDGLAGRKDSPANDAFARRPEEAAAARDAEPPEAEGVVESETPESKPATEAPASDVRATTTVPRDPKPPEVTENVVENGTSASKWVSETGARTQGREETSARASGDADEPEVDGVVENGTSEESKPAAEAVARLEDDAAKTSENDDPGRRRRRVSQSLATPPRARRRSRGESEPPRPPGRTALPPIAAAASTSRSREDDADSAELVARSRPHHRSPGRRHVRLPPLNDPSAAAADPDRDLPPPPGDAPPDDDVAATSPAAAAEPASRHADEKNAEELGRSPPRKLRQNESTASALAPSAAGQTRSAYPHKKIATPGRCTPQKARQEDSSSTVVSTETASGHADEKSAKHGRNPPMIKLWRDESLLVSSSAVTETRSRHADETDADPGRCPPGYRRQGRRIAADASTGTVSGNPPRKPWPDDIGALGVRNDYALYTSTHSLTHESRVRPSAVAETVSRYADERTASRSRRPARQLRRDESCSSSAVSSSFRFSAAATFSRHADEKDSDPASPVGNDGEVRRGSSSPAARRSVAVAESRTPPTARDRSPAAAAAAAPQQQLPRKPDENCNVVAGVSRSDGIGVSQTNTARSGRDAESQDVITSRYTGSEP